MLCRCTLPTPLTFSFLCRRARATIMVYTTSGLVYNCAGMYVNTTPFSFFQNDSFIFEQRAPSSGGVPSEAEVQGRSMGTPVVSQAVDDELKRYQGLQDGECVCVRWVPEHIFCTQTSQSATQHLLCV
jgi:hypothetical protein